MKDRISGMQDSKNLTESTSEPAKQEDGQQNIENLKKVRFAKNLKFRYTLENQGKKITGPQLRSYRERLNVLTLPKLRKILRFHLKEKSATELYQLFQLKKDNLKEVKVPFLVTSEKLEQPIVGDNVVELFVKTNNDNSNSPAVIHGIATSLSNAGEKDVATELVNLIQSDNNEFFCPTSVPFELVSVELSTYTSEFWRFRVYPSYCRSQSSQGEGRV